MGGRFLCRRGVGLVAVVALVAALVPAVPRPAAAEERSFSVTHWNEAFVEAVQAESTPPGLAARNLAILHRAIHEAVGGFPEDGDAAVAAAGSAARRVATVLYPSRAARFEELIAEGGSQPEAVKGGRATADAVLASRRDDGASLSVHYVPDDAPGQWRRTTNNRPPELPQWPKVKPFVLASGPALRPEGPPALDSEEYAAALDEVRRLGGKESAERTAEQTLIARFWADFSYTSTPPGHWNEIARDVARRRQLGLRESARLFAVLNTALADAGIAAFDAKYHFNFWRPVTAIARAEEDGNEATASVEDWKPLLPTPTHPEYVSAHSTFSGAAAEVLATLLGTDEVAFSATSFDVPGVVREYRSFRGCAEEIGMSRIYGGIHYRFSNEDGLALGRAVARKVLAAFGPNAGGTAPPAHGD